MSAECPFDARTHRFFRAMVLMGSGIALGCGGMSESNTANQATGGTSAQGGTGAGSTGGTGGTSSSTGGDISPAGGTGGTINPTGGTGGTISPAGGTGGTGTSGSTSGSTSTGGGSACPPSQWSCATTPQCADGLNYELPANCTCDLTRPLAGSECSSGARACLEATVSPDGTPLAQPVPFECSCAPDPTSCATSCHAVFPGGDGHFCSDLVPRLLPPPMDPAPTASDILCGCSYVYLK
jgi:hypothetical protein